MSLQEAAITRKEKLAALKKRKADSSTDSFVPFSFSFSILNLLIRGVNSHENEREGVFKFRNYDPTTGSVRKHVKTAESETIESQVLGLAERIIAQDELTRNEELDLINIQPKKPNWDLKRDLERKLGKLKGKTDAAIAQLIR